MKKLCEWIRKFNDRYFYFCEMHPILSILLHLPFLASTKDDKIKFYYSPYDIRWKLWYYWIKPKYQSTFVVDDVTKHCELAKGKFSRSKCEKQRLFISHRIENWFDYVMAHNDLPKDQQTDWLKEFEFTEGWQVQKYYNYWTKRNMMSSTLLRSNEYEYYMGTASYGPMESEELRKSYIKKVSYKDADEIGLVDRTLPVFHKYTWILWLTGRWSLIDYLKDAWTYGVLMKDPVELSIPDSYKEGAFRNYPRYFLKFSDSYWHSYPDTLKRIINEYLKDRNDELRQMIDHAHGEKTYEEYEEEMKNKHLEEEKSDPAPKKGRRRRKKSAE